MTPSKSRSKVTVYRPWRICRRSRLAMCNSSKNSNERCRRRPPFQRRDVRERIEPAPDRRRAEWAARDRARCRQAPGIDECALGIGQGVIGREQFVEAQPCQVRQAADALGRQRPGVTKRPALDLFGQALAKQRRAAVGRRAGGCRKAHVGVVRQQHSALVEMAKISTLFSTRSRLMEGYLNGAKSGHLTGPDPALTQ